ncbi:MAG: pantetheine-phosphate adenylyltransferase [Bryobacterales bacterium]|nr:pantetheine-phosphate adenylyltransferase [Bryobacterales bacterium]
MDSQRHQKALALYPGSFDPLTFGHIDLIERAARLFDNLVVAVVQNPSKHALFSVEERIAVLREVCSKFDNVEVDSFEGLLVNYARRRNASVLIRGIRAISDYEYELQMALMNRRLQPEIETVFLLAGEAYSFISSRMVKEVFALGGDVSGLVPAAALERLRQRIQNGADSGQTDIG